MTQPQMKLQDDDYNKKERTPNVVELTELARRVWSVILVRKVYLAMIDKRLTHLKRRSVEEREKRWTLGRWWMMMIE